MLQKLDFFSYNNLLFFVRWYFCLKSAVYVIPQYITNPSNLACLVPSVSYGEIPNKLKHFIYITQHK